MNPPEFLRHVWLMFVAVNSVNALILKFRSGRYIRQRPELKEGYKKLFWGILIWGNLPWLIMGVGLELGNVPSIFSYFRPRDGNPFVLAFIAGVVMLWILGFHWIFVRRGAEFLIEHPGLLQNIPQKPGIVRAVYCLMVAGGIVGLALMLMTNIGPDFK